MQPFADRSAAIRLPCCCITNDKGLGRSMHAEYGTGSIATGTSCQQSFKALP